MSSSIHLNPQQPDRLAQQTKQLELLNRQNKLNDRMSYAAICSIVALCLAIPACIVGSKVTTYLAYAGLGGCLLGVGVVFYNRYHFNKIEKVLEEPSK